MYRLDFYDLTGTKKYEITDNLWISYTKKVNSSGSMQMGYWGDSEFVALIEDKWQVEVYRRISGQWVRDFVCFYRNLGWEKPDKATATFYFRGLNGFLAMPIVAYPAETTDRTRFLTQPAETIAKNLVTYNATTAGTLLDGRDVAIPNAYPWSGMSVEADAGLGTSQNWYCTRANLLSTLQDLASVGGGDFDVVKTSDTTWEFKWFDGQLGTDRTATVVFAMERDNMGNPRYSEIRAEEKTVAIAGGEGEKADRDIEVRTGENYSTTNHVEMFVNASDVKSKTDGTGGLITKADEALEETKAKSEFSFDVIQVENSRYGIHYFLGDLVTAINPLTNTAHEVKIDEVTVTYQSDGNENIKVGLK